MRRRRARRRPSVQFYADLQDGSSIGYVAREIAGHLGSTMGTDCTVQCTTGRRALDVPAAIQRHVKSADIGFFVGFPMQSRKYLWQHKHFIGAYVCEGDRIPSNWVRICNQHSAIVVPSEYCKTAFANSGVTVPIHVVHHGLAHYYRPEVVDRFPGFCFLSIFMANPWMARKGVVELFGAFARLKQRYENVWLYVKTNACPAVSAWSELPGVTVVLNRYTPQQIADLYRRCHSYIQPTRGEGFGLTYLEALACGTPIVLPAHTGVLEFIDKGRDCIIKTDGSLVSLETYENPVGRLYDVNEDAVYEAMLDAVQNQSTWQQKALGFDRAAWGWAKALAPLHGVLESVRALPARVRPPEDIQEERENVIEQQQRASTAVFPVAMRAPKTTLPNGLPVSRRAVRRPQIRRAVCLYMDARQRKAYEDDPTGLGQVVRALSQHFDITDQPDSVLLAPYNPEHCNFKELAARAPVIAFTTFESTKWPEWWVKDLNHCALVLVPQQWVKEALLASGCTTNVEVVPQAFKVRQRPARVKGQPFTFGFIGVPVQRKNWSMLKSCIPQGAHLRAHFAWCPKGPTYSSSKTVHISSGRLTEDELDASFWSQIDCLVVPSAGEGYSMVAREAIAMGIPTIVSDIPAHADIDCTKIKVSGEEPAWFEFCGQTIGTWWTVDEADLRQRLEAALRSPRTVDQHSPAHSWSNTAALIKREADFSAVTFCPAEAEGGGVERFSRRLASEWDGAHHVSNLHSLRQLGPLVRLVVLQFEYGLFPAQVLAEVDAMKSAFGFAVLAIVHSANQLPSNATVNDALARNADVLILLNRAQRSVFPSGVVAEHPWPEPAAFNADCGEHLGNHGNIHPQKGYRHLFGVARKTGRPVRLVGKFDTANAFAVRTHREQIKPFVQPQDDLCLSFVDDESLERIMSTCAAVLYPYEPLVNIQASGAIRDAIRFGRPVLCSDHDEYFDTPECFPRMKLANVDSMAKAVESAVANAGQVFSAQADYARAHGWDWFVDVLRSQADTLASPRRRSKPLVLLFGGTLGLGGAEKVTVDIANALYASGKYGVHVAMAITSKGIYAGELADGIRVFDTQTPRAMIEHVQQYLPDGILINNSAMAKPVVADMLRHRPSVLAVMVHGFVQWSLNVIPQPLPLAAEVVTISDFAKAGLLRVRPDLTDTRVTVLRNGIDTDRFRMAVKASEIAELPKAWKGCGPIFGYAGRLSAEKALTTMVEVFALARRDLPDARLLIVGGADPDGVATHVATWKENERLIQHAISVNDVKDAVHITGVVTDPERWYRAMDVLLLTSHFEGLPLVVLEAMASGVPVVSTAVGSVPELLASGGGVAIESGAGWMAPKTKTAFAKCMVDAARIPGKMGQNGRQEIIRHYSMRAYRDQVLAFFDARVKPRRLRVASLYDTEGWAFHMVVDKVRRGMPDADGSLVRYENLARKSLEHADVVYSPSYVFIDKILEAVGPSTAIVSTVADHYTWKDGNGALELRKTIDASAIVLCTNRRLYWEVRKAHPDARLAVCMSGVDSSLFKPHATKQVNEKLVVGWAGSTKYHQHIKGIELIRRACAAIPGVEFVLADAGERQRSPQEMVEFYNSLDVYICMSSSEGTCNPILEAAACGVGVVSTDVGIASALLASAPAKAGVLIARDVGALSSALREAVRDREGVVAMGSNARAAIEDGGWDWKTRVIAYADAIRESAHDE